MARKIRAAVRPASRLRICCPTLLSYPRIHRRVQQIRKKVHRDVRQPNRQNADLVGGRFSVCDQEQMLAPGLPAGVAVEVRALLGGVGDGAHATHEHILISELPRRAALIAGLIEQV